MRLSQATGSSRRENGAWMLLSETLHGMETQWIG